MQTQAGVSDPFIVDYEINHLIKSPFISINSIFTSLSNHLPNSIIREILAVGITSYLNKCTDSPNNNPIFKCFVKKISQALDEAALESTAKKTKYMKLSDKYQNKVLTDFLSKHQQTLCLVFQFLDFSQVIDCGLVNSQWLYSSYHQSSISNYDTKYLGCKKNPSPLDQPRKLSNHLRRFRNVSNLNFNLKCLQHHLCIDYKTKEKTKKKSITIGKQQQQQQPQRLKKWINHLLQFKNISKLRVYVDYGPDCSTADDENVKMGGYLWSSQNVRFNAQTVLRAVFNKYQKSIRYLTIDLNDPKARSMFEIRAAKKIVTNALKCYYGKLIQLEELKLIGIGLFCQEICGHDLIRLEISNCKLDCNDYITLFNRKQTQKEKDKEKEKKEKDNEKQNEKQSKEKTTKTTRKTNTMKKIKRKSNSVNNNERKEKESVKGLDYNDDDEDDEANKYKYSKLKSIILRNVDNIYDSCQNQEKAALIAIEKIRYPIFSNLEHLEITNDKPARRIPFKLLGHLLSSVAKLETTEKGENKQSIALQSPLNQLVLSVARFDFNDYSGYSYNFITLKQIELQIESDIIYHNNILTLFSFGNQCHYNSTNYHEMNRVSCIDKLKLDYLDSNAANISLFMTKIVNNILFTNLHMIEINLRGKITISNLHMLLDTLKPLKMSKMKHGCFVKIVAENVVQDVKLSGRDRGADNSELCASCPCSQSLNALAYLISYWTRDSLMYFQFTFDENLSVHLGDIPAYIMWSNLEEESVANKFVDHSLNDCHCDNCEVPVFDNCPDCEDCDCATKWTTKNGNTMLVYNARSF